MKIETKYDIGQSVVLKTDMQKLERIISNITINPSNVARYCLQQGVVESWNYEFEIDEYNNGKQAAGFKK